MTALGQNKDQPRLVPDAEDDPFAKLNELDRFFVGHYFEIPSRPGVYALFLFWAGPVAPLFIGDPHAPPNWLVLAAAWGLAGYFVHVGNLLGRFSPYHPGRMHERIHKQTYSAGMFDVIAAIEKFVQRELRDWQKEREQVDPNGKRVELVYRHSIERSSRLEPVSMKAGINASLRKLNPIRTFAPLKENVPYDLQCIIVAQHDRDHTDVTLTVKEFIDPNGKVGDYPIGAHFHAASLLYLPDYFGLRFRPFMATLLPVTLSPADKLFGMGWSRAQSSRTA
jgi:hypothetical protein